MKRLTLITSALALILTASTTFAAEESTWGQLKQTVDTAEVAAKKGGKGDSGTTARNSRTASQLFDANGGQFEILVPQGPNDKDDIYARFTVPAGALTEAVEITMTVHGTSHEDLVIEFAPGGLEFLIDAELDLWLGADIVAYYYTSLVIWHVHDDGTSEETYPLSISQQGRNSTVKYKVAIPGFSRYSTGGGF